MKKVYNKQGNYYKIYNKDCLIQMKKIKDNSIDLILCDLPYGTIKGMGKNILKYKKADGYTWDIKINTSSLFKIYEKILRPKGKLILFGQQPYTTELINFTLSNSNSNIKYCYPMYWLKNHYANILLINKAPVNYIEDISVFIKLYDSDYIHPLRKYSKKILDTLNLKYKEVNKLLGHRKAEHFLCYNQLQFSIPTEKVYNELVDKLNLKKYSFYKTYDTIKNIDYKYSNIFNLFSKQKSNVLEYKKDTNRLHPTQKPVDLLIDLIKTYSNENDLVLDNTMGSGSTGVACINTKRNFIGIELEKKYYKIAKKRLEENTISLF